MFKIDNNTIYLTRGDSAEFQPVVKDYEAKEGDKILFSATKAMGQDPALQIEVDAGNAIAFAAEDTLSLTIGTYIYDLKLVSDEEVSTFADGRFVLLGDASNARDQWQLK